MPITSARPIINAVAVDAVRRGLRMAFCRARSPGRPRVRIGADHCGKWSRRKRCDGNHTDDRRQHPEQDPRPAVAAVEADHHCHDAARGEGPAHDGADLRRRAGSGYCVAQGLDREHLGGSARRDERSGDSDEDPDDEGRPDRSRS